tara:strand:+ start:2104 stop:2280 length:177 start_codon:yes stop_codon:yes gene_type:complete
MKYSKWVYTQSVRAWSSNSSWSPNEPEDKWTVSPSDYDTFSDFLEAAQESDKKYGKSV